jgi:hypothetical protein
MERVLAWGCKGTYPRTHKQVHFFHGNPCPDIIFTKPLVNNNGSRYRLYILHPNEPIIVVNVERWPAWQVVSWMHGSVTSLIAAYIYIASQSVLHAHTPQHHQYQNLPVGCRSFFTLFLSECVCVYILVYIYSWFHLYICWFVLYIYHSSC